MSCSLILAVHPETDCTSSPGALLGALGIGVFETLVSSWLGDAWASAALYVAVLAVLSLRPQGLFGEPVGRRA